MDQLSAHLDRAWDLVSRGDLAGASLSAQKSLELDEDSPEAHNLLGYIHGQEGDPEAALRHYELAFATDDTYVEAMLNAAELLIHPFHEFDRALHLIEEALSLCEGPEETSDAILLRTDCYLHQGETESARRSLRLLPTPLPDHPSVKLRIARFHFELGDPDKSLPLLEEVLKQEPDLGEAQYTLGLVHEALGNERKATIAFLQTRELDRHLPSPPWALPSDQFETRLRQTIRRLPAELGERLDETLVVVVDLPGAEIVAEGIDPRTPLALDDFTERDGLKRVGRLFVYQRNIERLATGVFEVEEELYHFLERELRAAIEGTDGEEASSSNTSNEPSPGDIVT